MIQNLIITRQLAHFECHPLLPKPTPSVQERNVDLDSAMVLCILITPWSDWHRVRILRVDPVSLLGGNAAERGYSCGPRRDLATVYVFFRCVSQCLKMLICSHFPLFINVFRP